MTNCLVFFNRCLWGGRILCLKLSLSGLSIMDIAEEVEVMIKEICVAVSENESKLRAGALPTKLGNVREALDFG